MILALKYTPDTMARAYYGNLRNRQNAQREAWDYADEVMRFSKPIRGEK